MTHRSLSAAALLVTSTWLACIAPAQADYFVRPYVQQGAGVIDGYEKNGATERAENFGTALQAEVSLNQGTIRSYLQITGPGASAQATGVMGDRISVNDAAGTQLQFSFRFAPCQHHCCASSRAQSTSTASRTHPLHPAQRLGGQSDHARLMLKLRQWATTATAARRS